MTATRFSPDHASLIPWGPGLGVRGRRLVGSPVRQAAGARGSIAVILLPSSRPYEVSGHARQRRCGSACRTNTRARLPGNRRYRSMGACTPTQCRV